MAITDQLKNQHLLWRAAFGPNPEEFDQIKKSSQKAYFKALVKASSKTPEYINVASNVIKGLTMGISEAGEQQKRELNEEQRREFRKQSREDIKNLNIRWLNEMVNSDAQLREKIALFWHGHFACRNLNIFYQQLLLNVIRKNALGNFAYLLREVSKSGAMINFLNNNQNRKGHPNENFAREVMELFTLGRGNYTENDIKEAARAFTGWGADINGDFVFRKNFHDAGSKTIFGKTGNFDGDDVLDMLLEKKETATFIARKMYSYFVNENTDEDKVKWLAGRFYQSNYNTLQLVEDMFTSNWFYEAKNIGSRIKSPVELIAGIRRMLPMQIENEAIQLLIQNLLGQLLFYPPNVAGWPGGKSWIDSSSLMLRMRLPQMIQDNEEIKLTAKTDDDQQMGMKDMKVKAAAGIGRNGKQQISANINWALYLKKFDQLPKEKIITSLSGTLLQTNIGVAEKVIARYADAENKETFIKSITLQLMSTPEYQLC
jgi:uncharacterized protein (DUF1800 family)